MNRFLSQILANLHRPYVTVPSTLADAMLPTIHSIATQEEWTELLAARAENRLFISEYPYDLKSRPFQDTAGGKAIIRQLAASSDITRNWLKHAQRFISDLQSIPLEPQGSEPGWVNGMLPVLDAVMLYTMIRVVQPKTYLEVGSGNSTMFVRRAIRDSGLATKIVSIDPHPRAEIDAICDEVIRLPFETVPEVEIAVRLAPGDIVFIDNSHRSLPNSDVTVFFTETIQILPPDVIYGIHDICLPFDYPAEWSKRFYNEQYLLACYLLGGAGGDRIEFPGVYASIEDAFQLDRDAIFDRLKLGTAGKHSGGFWLKRSPSSKT